jgi:histidine ammonia-lyase
VLTAAAPQAILDMSEESYAHVFDGSSLGIDRLVALSQKPVRCAISAAARARVQSGRAIVEKALASGDPIYGATTGIGSQKDIEVPRAQLADFATRMIVSEATNFPGPAFGERVVRSALAVLINTLATGQCGVRIDLIEALLNLLAASRLPIVRRGCAFGVADLTPLSQLSLGIIGRSLDGVTPPTSTIQLAPKESVSLIDNNSFGLGAAALTLSEAERLLMAFDLAASVACEGFRAGLGPHTEVAGGGRQGYGLRRVRAALRGLLAGSRLNVRGEARLLQDPLSFRGITQVHGAACEAWSWACSKVEVEINSATDNPLVDLDSQCLRTSASMISVLPALALDCLRQALAKVAARFR